MHAVFWTMGLAAVGILLGWNYRASALIVCLLFTYQLLLDRVYYLNHYYLTCLVALILVFVPAHHACSIDGLRRPSLRSQSVPRWALLLLQFQIAIPYFYGGLSKLDPDWLRGQPMAFLLETRQHRLGLLASHAGEEWAILTLTYGGLLFDLLVVPLLMLKKKPHSRFCYCMLLSCNQPRDF